MVKRSPKSANADVFERKLRQLPKLIINLEPGNSQAMCEMASILVAGYEYWVTSKHEPVLTVPYQNEIVKWYNTIYINQVCLVLLYEDNFYKYTRNNISKLLRGHLQHNDQADRNKKDEAFRFYVWEGEKKSEVEFALTRNWLNSGGLKFDTGNLDSNNPFLEKISINDSDRKAFSTIESMVLGFALEFQEISQEGKLKHYGRLIMDSSEEHLINRFGEGIRKQCFCTIQWHKETFNRA